MEVAPLGWLARWREAVEAAPSAEIGRCQKMASITTIPAPTSTTGAHTTDHL